MSLYKVNNVLLKANNVLVKERWIGWSGLTSYWRLENTNDFFNTLNLTAANISYVAGKKNNCAEFNGSSSKFTTTGNTSYGVNGTLNFWLWMDGTGNQQIIDSGSNAAINIQLFNSKLYYRCTGVAGFINDTNNFGTAAWKMVTCIWNSTGQTLYINNGTAIASAAKASAGNPTNGTLFLGCTLYSTFWMDGRMDEVGIWNRALTAAEVTQLYNAGNGIFY